MKKKLMNIALLSLFLGALIGCSDWTEVNPKNYYEPLHDDAYYAQLREYKKSADHQVTFGWFGGWTAMGASLQGSLMGLPDSTDFVSMWGNWHSLTPEKIADKKRVKELKGTRVMMCFIVANCGDQTTPYEVRENWKENGFKSEGDAVKAFWGWKDGDEASIDAAIRKYAQSIIDTMNKYDWDGFDFDFEANYTNPGNIAGPHKGDTANPEVNRKFRKNMLTFIEELGKHIGPKSGTDRLFVIDGEPQNMHPDARDYFDYYIIQAYSYQNPSTDKSLEWRYNHLLKGLEVDPSDTDKAKEIASKLIFCEDFEYTGYADQGGSLTYQTRDGKYLPSLIGMAQWQTESGYRKGGVGTYHIEYDYKNMPEYKWIRAARGIMHQRDMGEEPDLEKFYLTK